MKTYIALSLIVLSGVGLSCKGPEGPQGPPGSGGTESLTDPNVRPKVIFTSPANGTQGPYLDPPLGYGNVIIRFNKIMDFVTLRRTISVGQANPGIVLDTNDIYNYPGGDIVSLYLSDSLNPFSNFHWRVAQRYTISVSTSARDINGNALEPEFRLTFTPEPFFRVAFTTPLNDASLVTPSAAVRLSLNSRIDTSVLSRIQIVPSILSRWRLSSTDSSTLTFEHVNFDFNTTYEITIPAGVTDKFGNALPQAFRLRFAIDAFRVTSMYPNGRSDAALDERFGFRLSGLVDTSTARRALTINPPTSYTLENLSTPAQDVSLVPLTELLPETTYTVSIDTSLRSTTGVKLAASSSFSFRTAPFRVTYHTPEAGAFNVPRSTTIFLLFNGKIDTSTVRSAFVITGGVVGNFNFSSSPSIINFTPTAALQPNSTYTVTIGTSLRTRFGTRMKSPHTFSFRTGS